MADADEGKWFRSSLLWSCSWWSELSAGWCGRVRITVRQRSPGSSGSSSSGQSVGDVADAFAKAWSSGNLATPGYARGVTGADTQAAYAAITKICCSAGLMSLSVRLSHRRLWQGRRSITAVVEPLPDASWWFEVDVPEQCPTHQRQR